MSDTHRSYPYAFADIAIVGMACMFPRAPDKDTFWSNILGKVNAIGEPMPEWGAERYDASANPAGARVTTCAGGFLRDLYAFDSLEFGIMPNSVDGGEPDHFLALKVARDALLDAGYLEHDHTATGVILGHSTYLHRGNANVVQHGVVLDQTVELIGQLFPDASAETLAGMRELLSSKLPQFNADIAPGLVPNVMTGRIANRLDLKGPNYLIDAACASSLLAVSAAMEELRRGNSDLMLAGGVNASMPAEVLMVFTQLGAMSEDATVRPFDEKANGTLLGEGLGVVALKRLDDAKRDGDRVYAVMKSVGQSSDGKALGLLAPSMDGEVLALERAYAQAEIHPSTIGLIEAHGTGIPLGDKTEIQALTKIFGERDGELPSCAIGSVKSMISHCIPAAGVAGLIKTALALHHRVLPPTLCDTPNEQLGLGRTRFYVNTEARPWVQREDRARRAAVNAFGFGGINTHAILEEMPDTEADTSAMVRWPTELALFVARDRGDLIAQLRAGIALAEDNPQASLRDLTYTLLQNVGDGPERLAVVANSVNELAKKLRKAQERLADTDRRRLQTRSGTFFSAEPLDGEMAFMFPGEGAQYEGMLSDLAIHFPVVRQWFDFWESIFAETRPAPSSSSVFPPPNSLDPEARTRLQTQLYSLRTGSESMFIANQALFRLLESFGVEADAMLGHSSGENSTLVASGMVRVEDRAQLREHILRLNRMYEQMESQGGVARGALLTIGAVPREAVIEMVDASDGKLHLALDNCHHQTVLFGAPDDMEAAATKLRKMGGLCVYLPFDRAYHTPLFQPVAETVERFLGDVEFGEPNVPVYSCVDAERFSGDPAEIRSRAAKQWSSRVRFIDTVERMYEDGIRYFVEVGPSGNLTAFVDDILRDKEHVAVAANNRNKTGLFQLLQLLGRLFVTGRDIRFDALFAGRGAVDLRAEQPPARRPAVAVPNTLPYLRIDAEEAAALRVALRGPEQPAETVVPPPAPAPEAAAPVATPEQSAPAPEDEFVCEDDARGELVREHLGLMHEFLQQQHRLFSALPAEAHPAAPMPEDAGPEPQPAAATALRSLPFLDTVIEQDERHAIVEVGLDVAAQRFLRHHVLYARDVSDLDPALTGLPVTPLSVSLEMLVEAAALLCASPYVNALENVRAYNWIAVDEGARRVRVNATLTDEPGRVHAAVCDEEGTKLLEGDVLFGDAPLAAEPALAPLANPQAPLWSDDDLYTTGMFHGPLFHSVGRLLEWDDSGMDLELADTPTAGFFDAEPGCELFLNPVLLDSIGHLTAFWLAQSLGTDFSSFPSSIGRIELLQPALENTAACRLRGRLSFVDGDASTSRFLEGNFDCVDPAGRAVFRIQGWRDRFFRVPHSFYFARTNPREGWYGEDWSALFPEAGEDTVVWFLPAFPAGFLEDAGAVWKRLLAFTVLSADERRDWHALAPNPQRRSEWLLGRLALKEAVRFWLAQREELLLYPADVRIRSGEHGEPFVDGAGLEELPALPEVSLAHVGGMCVAVAAPPGKGVGIDLETFGRVALEDFLQGALTPGERGQTDALPAAEREEFALRLWCAKEAAAKSLGTGLEGRPGQFQVIEIDRETGLAVIEAGGERIAVSVRRHDEKIIALANAG